MTNLLRSSSAAIALGAALLSAQAAPLTFDFKDPKGVNNVQFHLDAPLESISGTGTGISGQIVFDPQNPQATTGRIVLATSSLTVGNPMMRDHLHSEKWLDVAKFPEITFEAVKLGNVRTGEGRTQADVTGRLTVKGVTREVTVPVSFTHLPDKLGARLNDAKLKGDLLVLRAEFSINRNEFGIMAGQITDKVSETIGLTLSIAGAAPKT
jgi:polyisoprenoid-binding protein YceI